MRYQSTTGLSSEQIEELVVRIYHVCGVRKRNCRPRELGLYRSVVLTLIVLRSNLTQASAGDLLGISQPTVSRSYRRMMPLLEQVACLHRPPFGEAIAGRLVLVDGTDVPTGNRAGHEHNYSGKRHRQGFVVQVAASTEDMLLGVSTPVPGRTHDRRAYAETGWEQRLAGHDVIADSAYIGTNVITPRKRTKHMGLSTGDEANNKHISGIRSAVERCIAHLKNWKILATGYRGRLAELPNLIRILTTLEFYRLGW